MPIVTLEPASRRLPWPWWSVLIIVVWLVAVGAYEVAKRAEPSSGLPSTLCVFRRITGVPCPTCGTTRAVLAAGRGDLAAAVRLNPLAVAAGVLALGWLVLRVGFGRSIAVGLSRRGRRIALAIVIALFLANWGLVVWRDWVTANG